MSYLGRSAKLSRKTQEKVSFLATAGQTSKTGLSYVPTFVEVSVNGILLTDVTDYTATSGSSITFSVALELNDEVTVVSLKTFALADHYTKVESDAAHYTKSAADARFEPIDSAYTKAEADANLAALVDSSPAALNTLNELAAALGDDANFSTTVTNSIATKLPLAGGTMTGVIAGFESTGIDDNATSTAITIDANENVGIGGAIVGTRALTVSKAGAEGVEFNIASEANVNTTIHYNRSGASYVKAITNASEHTFENEGTEAMRIDSSGNVGIGVVPEAAWDTFTTLQIEGSSLSGLGENNTVLGSNIYHASNNYKYYGTGAATIYQQRLGEHRWYGAASGTAGNTANITQHMVIDSSGKVGIGTGSPASELQVEHAGGGGLTLKTSGGGNFARFTRMASGDTTNGDWSLEHSSKALVFKTNAASGSYASPSWTTAMTINNGGKLTVAARAFEVGTFSSTGASAGVKHNIWSNNEIGIGSSVASSSGQSHYAFYNTNGQVGYIQTSGSSTIYSTSSDYRLKENVTPMSGATAQTKLLKPCNFDWIAGGNVNGFLAHELAEVVPEAVTGTKDAMRDEDYEVTPAVVDDEGNETTAAVMGTRSVPDMQGIDQAKLVPLLTATIQELIARIEALEGAAP